MVNENLYTKKRLEDLQRDVVSALVQGAEVELRADENNVIVDKHGNQMYRVVTMEDGTFGICIDVAYSILGEHLERLMALKASYVLLMTIYGGSDEWGVDIQMVSPDGHTMR